MRFVLLIMDKDKVLSEYLMVIGLKQKKVGKWWKVSHLIVRESLDVQGVNKLV